MANKGMIVAPEGQAADQEPSAIALSTGGAATQNARRNIGLIIGREYKIASHSAAF